MRCNYLHICFIYSCRERPSIHFILEEPNSHSDLKCNFQQSWSQQFGLNVAQACAGRTKDGWEGEQRETGKGRPGPFLPQHPQQSTGQLGLHAMKPPLPGPLPLPKKCPALTQTLTSPPRLAKSKSRCPFLKQSWQLHEVPFGGTKLGRRPTVGQGGGTPNSTPSEAAYKAHRPYDWTAPAEGSPPLLMIPVQHVWYTVKTPYNTFDGDICFPRYPVFENFIGLHKYQLSLPKLYKGNSLTAQPGKLKSTGTEGSQSVN